MEAIALKDNIESKEATLVWKTFVKFQKESGTRKLCHLTWECISCSEYSSGLSCMWSREFSN